jgi:Leucine-rich repeat (LRR) protein
MNCYLKHTLLLSFVLVPCCTQAMQPSIGERPGLLDMPRSVLEKIRNNLHSKDYGHLRQTCSQLGKAQYQENPLVSTLLATTSILSFLTLKDIANLHKTCRSLRFVWDHERLISLKDLMKLPQLITLIEAMRAQNPIELNLGSNSLTSLPAEIQQLKQLQVLNLWGNSLSPEAIVQLCTWFPQLRELDLSLNKLTPLPAEMQELKQLQVLHLWGNSLTPEAIAQLCTRCPQLRELDLSDNKLTRLPAEIQQLKQLQVLHLRGDNSFSEQEEERIRQLLKASAPQAKIEF